MFSAVSFGGDFVLVGWLAHSVTGDSGWTGTAFALLFLPGFLLGAPAGSIADRYQRHHLIRVIELVAAGTMAAIAMVFAANCSFASPMGYQTNLLVMGPGHYKFQDFVRAGLPMILIVWVTFTLMARFLWGL